MLDSHAHILSSDTAAFPPSAPTREKLEYLKEHAFAAADLCAAMDEAGVEHALVVQRAQFYAADNSYVCAAAEGSAGRLRAVCGIDSRQDDCAIRTAEWLDLGAAGIRLMGTPQENTLAWLGGANAEAVWRLSVERDTVLCAHLFPAMRQEGLELIDDLLGRYPLRWLVLDHLANPTIDNADTAGIDDIIRRIAERPNVALKFTTIPLASLAERDIDGGRILEAYVALFGPERLIWGSDITQSPGSYADMVALAHQATAGLPETTRSRLLGDNARHIYRWE